MMSAMRQQESTLSTSYAARTHFKNNHIDRLSVCHSTQSNEDDDLLSESTQYNKASDPEMKLLPAIVFDGEQSEHCELTERGLSYDHKHLNPSNTLDAAVAQNNSELLKRILTSAADVSLDVLNASGGSVVHEAAFQGKLSCLSVFIKFGADLNLRDKEGWTPLHAAICGGDPEAVLMLLRSGASVNAVTNDGVEPLDMALECGDEKIIELVSEKCPRKRRKENRKSKAAPLACEENFNSNILDYM